jgi:hypothetical protein
VIPPQSDVEPDGRRRRRTATGSCTTRTSEGCRRSGVQRKERMHLACCRPTEPAQETEPHAVAPLAQASRAGISTSDCDRAETAEQGPGRCLDSTLAAGRSMILLDRTRAADSSISRRPPNSAGAWGARRERRVSTPPEACGGGHPRPRRSRRRRTRPRRATPPLARTPACGLPDLRHRATCPRPPRQAE